MALCVSFGMVSCKEKVEEANQKKGSSGKTLEMLLVSEKSVYAGSTKELVEELFRCPMESFLVPEPKFDVVFIPLSSFQNTEMFQVHRNVVILDVNPENPNKLYKHVDQYSAPQIIFEIAAKDTRSLEELLKKYQPLIEEEFRQADHRRVKKAYYSTRNTEVMHAIKEKFGFELTVSDEFMVAAEADNFMWIRKSTKDFEMNILVQTQPYTNKNMFDEGKILNNIDTIMRRHVQSPAEGSYPGTERRIKETRRQVTVADQYAVETRGWWRSFGDFYGGPYSNLTILTPDQKEVVSMTAFVYGQRISNNTPFPRRDYLIQAESIAWSIEF